jgi:hypothetical protein
MKKNYNCPAVEVLNISAQNYICATSTFENFTTVSPGTEIGADEGR